VATERGNLFTALLALIGMGRVVRLAVVGAATSTLLMGGALAALAASGAPSGWPVKELAAVARANAVKLDDPQLKTAFVSERTHSECTGVNFHSHAVFIECSFAPHLFVIVLHGHFTCSTCNTFLPGQSATATVVTLVWSPSAGVVYTSVGESVPKPSSFFGQQGGATIPLTK
jgi:hypothetical protein